MIGWRGVWCGWGFEGFPRDLHKDLGICKEVRGVRLIYFRYLKVKFEVRLLKSVRGAECRYSMLRYRESHNIAYV